jgi:hypothetical protein
MQFSKINSIRESADKAALKKDIATSVNKHECFGNYRTSMGGHK